MTACGHGAADPAAPLNSRYVGCDHPLA